MFKYLWMPAAVLGVLLVAAPSPVLAAAKGPTPAQGQKLATCLACHDISPAKVKKMGPPLFGLIGAKPMTTGLPYAKWDKKNLDAFLADPSKVKPGTLMGYKVTDAAERKAVVEALAGLK